jgi:hypothetical protein
LKSAFCHDSDEPGGFARIDARFHNWPKASRHRGRARVVEVFSLNAKVQSRPDLLLLLSLLVAILLTPVFNQDQHLLIAWVGVGGDLSGDRRFLSGFNPDWKRPI